MFLRTFLNYQIRPRLEHLILHVTGRCNMRCRHCFIDFDRSDELTLQRIQSLAREIGKITWLDITGGEPFLRDDIVQIIRAFQCHIVQIPSNGTLPEKMVSQIKLIQKSTNARIVVSLSIDGLEDIHDKLRRKPGHYRQVWQAFDQLRRIENLTVKINTVLCQSNASSLIDLMREVRRRNPDFHSIILLRGEPNDSQLALPPVEQLDNLAPEIFQIIQTYKFGSSWAVSHFLENYYRYLWNLSIRVLKTQRQSIPCLAGQAHIVVWPNGEVGCCEILPPVGNLSQQSLQNILNSSKMKAQREFIRGNQCACTHNCVMLDSILLRPASIPHLFKQKIGNK